MLIAEDFTCQLTEYQVIIGVYLYLLQDWSQSHFGDKLL